MRCKTGGSSMLLILTMFVMPLLAIPQQLAPVRRIGFLDLGAPPSASESTPLHDTFRGGLRERGWVEGHNIRIEWRWAEGTLERFATLVVELVHLRVEVLVVPNAETAEVAQQITTMVPIVVVGAGSLVERGLVESLARPGTNITGISTLEPETAAHKLELLKEVLPGATRVAMLRGLSSFRMVLPVLERTAQALGVELYLVDAREPTAFDSAFATMTAHAVDALVVLGDPSLFPYRTQIADLAVQHKLPSVCVARGYVEAGCLMSYGAHPGDRGQRVAAYVDKILQGTKPADLPVEQGMRIELVLNLKTAKALGLTLSPGFLFRADEVIR
jgi:putative tryptophan/tyrosine transport system substrate-binding protein